MLQNDLISATRPLQSDEDLDALKLIIKDIKYDKGKDLNENLKDYFLGIDAGIIDNIEKLDRKTMYDFCYNEEKIKDNGEQDLKTLKDTTQKIENIITSELQKNQQAGVEAYTIKYGKPLLEADDNNQNSDMNNY